MAQFPYYYYIQQVFNVSSEIVYIEGIRQLHKFSRKKKKNDNIFAGDAVFEVSNEVFCACKGEKPRYERYAKHVGNDEIGESIRQYGLRNPGKAIIIKDATYGTMMYLRRKK